MSDLWPDIETREIEILNLEVIWAQLVNGIIIGSSYALIAMGLTLIYGILGVINFAHGELVMGGAYGGLLIMNATNNYLLALLGAIVSGAILAVGIERIAIRPVRKGTLLLPLITTLGMSLILQSGAFLIFGPNPQAFNTPFIEPVVNIGFTLSLQRILILVVSLVLIGGIYAAIRFTYAGKALRAVAQDREAARLMGINPELVVILTFAISGALAGAAGALIGPLLLVFPTMGQLPLLKAVAIVVLGGFGNIEGAIVAALFIGLIESFAGGFLPNQWVDTIIFVLLIAVLIVRPTGIIRERLEENV